MALPMYDEQQREDESFSKICYIPSLGLSCFGCCGHHFKGKAAMHRFFAKNQETMNKFLAEGKSYEDFMNREQLLDPCGGCYSLIHEDGMYKCGVHPLRIGREIRIGYCDHDYLCHTAGLVNRMTDEEKKLFYDFLKEQQFDAFTYSIINSQETVLIEKYREWKEKRTTAAKI
jgi:hypothetical protein